MLGTTLKATSVPKTLPAIPCTPEPETSNTIAAGLFVESIPPEQ